MKSSERIIYLDCLRVVAIFAMMLLHVSASCWALTPVSGYDWQVLNFYDSLVRFCVPVFVMISGVFFLDNGRTITYKRLFTHNISRIVTAFLFWSVVYACVIPLLEAIVKGRKLNMGAILRDIAYGHYHMWFLFVIVGLYVITPFLRQIAQNAELEKAFIILSLVLCCTINFIRLIPETATICDYISRFDVYMFSGYAGYFMLGHFLHNNELGRRTRMIIYILAAVSLIFTITATSVWSVSTQVARAELYEYLLPNTFFVSTAVFLIFKNIKFTMSETCQNIICRLSALSFGMYLVHDFVNIAMVDMGIIAVRFNPLITVPVISVGVFACSFVIIFIVNKIPVINKWIM